MSAEPGQMDAMSDEQLALACEFSAREASSTAGCLARWVERDYGASAREWEKISQKLNEAARRLRTARPVAAAGVSEGLLALVQKAHDACHGSDATDSLIEDVLSAPEEYDNRTVNDCTVLKLLRSALAATPSAQGGEALDWTKIIQESREARGLRGKLDAKIMDALIETHDRFKDQIIAEIGDFEFQVTRSAAVQLRERLATIPTTNGAEGAR